jgi:superfamily II DNA or RNA helicase
VETSRTEELNEAVWAPGTSVRHRATGDVGVVIELRGADLRVAFGSEISYLSADDVEILAPEPHQQLAQGQLDDSATALLRLLAVLVEHSFRYDPGSSLSNARLEPWLHQAFVAHRIVAEKVAPRMILADEVGLGKTIEAGLAIKELRARQAVERVLIIVPASLTQQWQAELSGKFNEPFEILNGASAKHFARGGANPFLRFDNVICSLPFATQAKRAEQIVEAGWDLVLFDEAHRVRRTQAGSKARVTQAYRLADELKDQVHGLLLLSATPVQLHESELFGLVELVEPGLFRSLDDFNRQRRDIPALNDLMQKFERWPSLGEEARSDVAARHAGVLSRLVDVDLELLDDPVAREHAKNSLVDAHPLAAAMVRNRKSELGMAGKRIATLVAVSQTPAEKELYDDVGDYIRETYSAATTLKNNAVGFLMVIYQKMLTSSSHALRVSFRRRIEKLQRELATAKTLKPKRDAMLEIEDPLELSPLIGTLDGAALGVAKLQFEIDRLLQLADRLDDARDTKIGRAVQLVQQVIARGGKCVVFTQFIETQKFLSAALEHNGLTCAMFNGQMSADEKEQAIRVFRGAADVLVSTEAGGEGRNLQFANVLINYDLPWNPMKVEQRIGRLDRIGQTRPVEIYNLVYQDTLEERIVQVLQDRIKLFEESVGSLDPILGDVEKSIEKLVMTAGAASFAEDFEAYAKDLGRRVKEARLLEETLADFVMDRASFRKDEADRLLGRDALARPKDLEQLIRLALDYLGGSLVDHSDGGMVINLSPRLAARTGFGKTSRRGVFDPSVAVHMDELDLFAFGHPVVDRLLAELRDLPSAAVGARESSDVPAGLWIEVLWRVKAHMVVNEGILIRHLINESGKVHSSNLTKLPLSDRPISVPVPAWAPSAIRASETTFKSEFAERRSELETRFHDIREERLRRSDRIYDSRRARLRYQITQAEEWIAARESGEASERDRRVLPARRGLLARDRERLAQVDEERQIKREELLAQRLDIRGEVLSAALVVGA